MIKRRVYGDIYEAFYYLRVSKFGLFQISYICRLKIVHYYLM
jgi:hypothetical protein